MLRAGAAEAPPRDLGLRIAHDGSWHYLGSPIKRIELVRLFASVLRRREDGRYWLITPVERGLIEVEDVPFVAVELEVEEHGGRHDQRLRLRTNLDQWVTIDNAHRLRLGRPAGPLAQTSGPIPYVLVRDGLEARLARPVYYQLVELGEEDRHQGVVRFGVWSAGCFFPLDDAQA